ncbi:hypothetical protein EVAR_32137_1 [Eumeta japonica]|uniref:Uncharacterized protein n=1 Tax=Eumeta variegata TaxID=151549 RepID=A0A4C1V4A5_EUMVA|nr:hypothetical protein EVAR_32137_1 [Eumeta japonica]
MVITNNYGLEAERGNFTLAEHSTPGYDVDDQQALIRLISGNWKGPAARGGKDTRGTYVRRSQAMGVHVTSINLYYSMERSDKKYIRETINFKFYNVFFNAMRKTRYEVFIGQRRRFIAWSALQRRPPNQIRYDGQTSGALGPGAE